MRLWEPASPEEKFIGIALGAFVFAGGLASALVLLWIGRAGDILLSVSIGAGIFTLVLAGAVVATVARDGRYELRENLGSAALVGLISVALSLILIVMMRAVEVVEFYYEWRDAGQ